MFPRYVCQQWEEKNLWYGSLLLCKVFTDFLYTPTTYEGILQDTIRLAVEPTIF